MPDTSIVSDADDSIITITLRRPPENGTVRISKRSVIYTSRPGWAGIDSTIVDISDSKITVHNVRLMYAVFPGGSGTPLNPYWILNAEDLDRIRYALDASFILKNDIDLSSQRFLAGKGWKPIGSFHYGFNGTLDGDGHIIRNLHIARPAQNHCGLFASGAGIVENIGLINVLVEGNIDVGGLAGGNGLVLNSYLTGEVMGEKRVNFLINQFTPIVCCYTAGKCFSKGKPDEYGFIPPFNRYASTNLYHTLVADPFGLDTTNAPTPLKNEVQLRKDGWDFKNVWQISKNENHGLPFFRDNPKPDLSALANQQLKGRTGDTRIRKVRASSIYHNSPAYQPANVLDRNLKTAWVEGAPSDGVGEWIEFIFDTSQLIGEIKLVNGYTKSKGTFYKNSRVRQLKMDVFFRDSVYTKYANFFREPLYERMLFQPDDQLSGYYKGVTRIRFTIESVFKGEKFDDVGISEIVFSSKPRRY